jgi:hypothetical protein
MTKEIKFEIEVSEEKDFKKAEESLRVQLANLELTGLLKIVDNGKKEQE